MISYDPILKIFYSTKINDANYFSGFGTKELGDAKNFSSLLNFFQTANFSYKTIVMPDQIHSSNTVFFEKDQPQEIEKIEATDGVATKAQRNLLTVITADCLPIIYADKKNKIIGISHQGWRGTLKKLQQKMITKMLKNGASLDSMLVAIGPGIGDCCYDLDEDRYHAFLDEFDGYSKKIFHFRGNKIYINLTLLNFLLLTDIGVKKENIDFFPFCTSCDNKRFFSFRRDKKGGYGEMLSFILRL